MIRAEIKTDAGIYDIELENITDLKTGWLLVEETLAAYMPFESDTQFIIIGAGASLKHIRVYNEDHKTEPMIQAPKDSDAAPEVVGIFEWETRATYLGNQFTIKGVGHRSPGQKPVYMAVTINGGPAGEALNSDKLNELLAYWRESEGDSPGTYVIYKLPEGLILAEEDAGSFLLEAIKGIGYTTDNKTAVASFDWKGGK